MTHVIPYHSHMVAERRCDTATNAARRRRSEKEDSDVETKNAEIRDEGGLENDCVDEEETEQVLVNGRWVTVAGADAEYIKQLIVSIAQMERKMGLTVASDSLDVALKQEGRIRKVLETVEFPQVQFPDRVADVPLIQEEIVEVIRVADSEDLPLNISGETLLENKTWRVIKKSHVTKYLEMLAEVAEQKDDSKMFYEQFVNRMKLESAELLRFNTCKSEDEQFSFDEYVDRMKEGENDIYHITGESIAMVSSSLFLENLRKKGHEVLYVIDPVDEHAVRQLKEFDGTKLKPTTKKGFDLGEELKTESEPLKKLMNELLGDKVEMVIASDRIVDSRCVLTTSEYGWSAKMERIMEVQALRDNSMTSHMVSKKTMEVNPAAWQQQHEQQHQQQFTRQAMQQQTGEKQRERGERGEGEKGRKDEEGRGQRGKRNEKEGEVEVKKDVTDIGQS